MLIEEDVIFLHVFYKNMTAINYNAIMFPMRFDYLVLGRGNHAESLMHYYILVL